MTDTHPVYGDDPNPEGNLVGNATPWVFGKAEAASFTKMFESSIPDYETMRELTSKIAVNHLNRPSVVNRNRWVLDIGCSRGGAMLSILTNPNLLLPNSVSALGLDSSPEMIEAARSDIESLGISPSRAKADLVDLRQPVDQWPRYDHGSGPDVILSVLTLIFLPVSFRQKVLADLYSKLAPGGMLLVVEKLLGSTHAANQILVRQYEEMKINNGYSHEEVRAKAKSLEYTQMPNNSQVVEAQLVAEGFRIVEPYWRFLNFAAWFAIKPERGEV